MTTISVWRRPLLILLAPICLGAAPAPAPPGTLLPHRAIYAIGLAETDQGSGVTSADGRMVFELTGNRCKGYTMRQRLVVNLGDQEGKNGVLDFRISTFESGSGDLFRFNSRTTMNEEVIESIEGVAKRTGSEVEVDLAKPKDTTVKLSRETLFPSQHLQAILDAARGERRLVSAVIFEGSGGGETADDAVAAIGAATQLQEGEPATIGVRNWPVSVGYFSEDRPAALPGLGEETPAYQMSFRLYENGVTDRLVMNYGKYALSGTLERIEPLAGEACP